MESLFAETNAWAQNAADHAADARAGSEPARSSLTAEELAHQASLRESIRKLADLEKDRPMWEAARQEREERQHAEALAQQVEAESRREAEEKARHAAEERAAAEAALNAELERSRIEELLYHSRLRHDAQWREGGPWTDAHAFARHETLSAAFDKAKFSADNPMEFYDIPWPVLWSPILLRSEDICWEAVEAFFATASQHMTPANYRVLVSETQRRFHPDRWTARRIVMSLGHEPLLQKIVAEAGNLVSQAITPIWREVKNK